MNEYNTWDYKVGDLRNYWEWVSAHTGRTMFFHEIKAYTLSLDHKVKLLARGEV